MTLLATSTAPTLRRLYFVRFGFAIVWAALMVITGSHLNAFAGVLLVLYPAFDVAAAVTDSRTTRSATTALYANIAISTLTAIGLAIAATSGVPAVLRVWGAWAIIAGLIQLTVALLRRRMGGQWAMIISGGISVLAGLSFVAMASGDDPKLTALAGYATLGGIFFLISALRLGRTAKAA